MEIRYEQPLRDYILKKGKKYLLVEMVEINNSDIDMTELHVRFVNQRLRDQFVDKKRYRVVETELGEVLFPRFPLQMEETVSFGLRSFLGIKSVRCTGIKV